jgi:eukaryotic-like serine/threonine-protein kinase
MADPDPEKLIETLIQQGLDESAKAPSPLQAAAAPPPLPSVVVSPMATKPNTQPPAPGPEAAVHTVIKGATGNGASQSQSAQPTGSGVSQSGATGPTQPAQGQAMSPGPGTRIHHYEIIKRIGRGGMGAVFLARDTRLGRKVAIKFLHTSSMELTKRFILEARATAALQHENIIVIYEVDAWQGAPFMVFEFLSGPTLGKFVPDNKALPPPRAVELMMPVVKALAYAHSKGIVHRDLKPDNIIVADSGGTKVLDFGIAKVLQGDDAGASAAMDRPRAPKNSFEDQDDAELTMKGAMMGTMAYMAPEQWGIGVEIDHRADIWSAGIMLYRMLAGEHPLAPLVGPQLSITGSLKVPMPTLHSKAPDVPAELAKAVDKCLMKRKDDRWADAGALLRALEPFMPGRFTREIRIDESPYAGLSSFQESDADRFFGRAMEIASTVNRVRERPLMAVVGSSGAGKSSFVRAGLVPALKRSGEPWESIVLRPGRNPLQALASVVAPLVGTSSSVADDVQQQQLMMKRLAAEPGFAGAVLRSRARQEKKNLLIFIDQFEELYTLVNDPKERKAFTASLSAIADDQTSPIRLIISIRSDFLDRVNEDPHFMAELNQGLIFLSSPGNEGLRDAIVQPAELAGYRFESADIAEEMIQHLASTTGALPLLQFCATKLWDLRDVANKVLTRKAYNEIGGVAGALAAHADAVMKKVAGQSHAMVRAIMLRMVTPERTRAIVGMDELRELTKDPSEVQRLIDELVQARLLVVQTGGGAATVELVHESLIHTWPLLKKWLEESGEDSAFIEQVRNASKQWVSKGKDKHLLWRGELADESARFLRRYRGELASSQREFLEGVIAAAQAGVRQKRLLAIAAFGGMAVLLVLAGVALLNIRSLRDEAVGNLGAAKLAEEKAKQNEARAVEEEKKAVMREAEAKKAREDAEKANAALGAALDKATKAEAAAREAELAAKASEGKAFRNAAEALAAKQAADSARKRADAARADVAVMLDKEKARNEKLQEQLGGGQVLETLK